MDIDLNKVITSPGEVLPNLIDLCGALPLKPACDALRPALKATVCAVAPQDVVDLLCPPGSKASKKQRTPVPDSACRDRLGFLGRRRARGPPRGRWRLMTRGVRVRLVAFVVLSAVGIVYVASNFLGITDRLLGKGVSIEATLPGSGGLFTGSEVTYRGVKVGKVSAMDVTPEGLRVKMALKDGTKIPLDSKIYVHNLSAVGEQYLDFEPPDNDPPYAKKRRRHQGRRVEPADERGGTADPDGLAGHLGRRH